MGWPSGIPPWQEADLKALSASGQLSGVNPLVLAGIDQEESDFEIAGAGYNSSGYGGFFGLGTKPYPGNNQETVASLEDPSENSFKHQAVTAAAAFNSYMTEAASEGYTGSQITDRAETIFQQGGNYKGIEPGGGVSVVDQALGTAPNTGGTTTTGSGASGGSGSSGSAGSGSASSVKLTGIAGILQQINDLMNPPALGSFATITTLGTASVGQALETFLVRGLFAVAFLGIAYVGVKQITGGGGSSNVIEIVEKQQRIAANKEATASRERNTQTRANAQVASSQAAIEKAATPKRYVSERKETRETNVNYNTAKTGYTTASKEAAGGVKTAASELAEGALLI